MGLGLGIGLGLVLGLGLGLGLGLEDVPGEAGACIEAAQEAGQRLHVGCGRRGGIGLE